MRELSGCDEKRFDLCIDNKSAIEISGNPIHHGRTKHIEVQYHFIRKCVEEGKVNLIQYTFGWETNSPIYSQNCSEFPSSMNSKNELVSKG